jgi:hypothetical protein
MIFLVDAHVPVRIPAAVFLVLMFVPASSVGPECKQREEGPSGIFVHGISLLLMLGRILHGSKTACRLAAPRSAGSERSG